MIKKKQFELWLNRFYHKQNKITICILYTLIMAILGVIIYGATHQSLSSNVSVKYTVPYYTITFDPNGGTLENTGGGGGVSSKQVKLGDTYGDLPLPSKPGYSFDGWYEKTLITSESVNSTPCDKTLVAKWNDGIKIDMREWNFVPPPYEVNFENAFTNWNVNNARNEFDFCGVGGSEVKYTTLNLKKNKTYSVVFDYVIPNFAYTNSTGNVVDKMFSYITSINPATNTLYLMTDKIESVVSIYSLNSNTSGRAVLSLTAREDATYYLIINFGYLDDNIDYHFEFNNFTLYTHQCSFG